jgi:hypothetical protein
MDIKVNDQALDAHFQELIKSQIFAMFTPELREKLVKEAVRKILEDKDKYTQKTMLADAMDRAVQDLVKEIARDEVINNTEIRTQLQDVVSKAITKSILSPEREELLVTKLTDLFTAFITSSSRY